MSRLLGPTIWKFVVQSNHNQLSSSVHANKTLLLKTASTVIRNLNTLNQGFSLASAIGHSRKIVPDVRDFAVQFGQFVRDDFRKHTLYGYAQ